MATEVKPKLKNALIELKDFLSDKPKGISLASFFYVKGLAKEYSAYIRDKGVVVNISGGKRGISVYQWGGIDVTDDLVIELIDRYNKARSLEGANSRGRGRINHNELVSTIGNLTISVNNLIEMISELKKTTNQ